MEALLAAFLLAQRRAKEIVSRHPLLDCLLKDRI